MNGTPPNPETHPFWIPEFFGDAIVVNGKTWPYIRNLETGRPGFGMTEQRPKTPGREEYSYPTVMQSREGTIYVAFTYQRQTIKVVSFDEDWLRKGGN